ncbi:glycosyltransferase family 2 protein [Chitinophaga japonensis]|uniref:GT2 family glycosyltransferase n=1 Tax=Chitinophaga japonensis TaxID=104662 RepID=A0A562SN23_CHIJA|nr:glycosyltransferase [Chitinophaga japonensis]TWI82675.1 GT2 family glycosyltransferase [Chitinophaga japonensis]
MEKKITIVIPTFCRPLLLTECLKSLARQQFDREAFEVIVVSDGPDLLTKQVVVSWKHTGLLDVVYIPLPRKKGPAAARNAGWKVAAGRLVAFTDDDCLPDPMWLQNIWEAWQGEELMAYSGRIIVPVPVRPTDYEWNIAQLEKARFVTANCVCTRPALERAGGFDERFELAWREDSDLEFRFLQQQVPIQYLPEAIVVHPVREATWGVSLREQRKAMFNALLYKKFPRLFRNNIKQRPIWSYYVMIICFMVMIAAIVLQAGMVAWIAFAAWLLLLAGFIWKRLMHTSRAWPHVMEMIVTSMLIPFLSVYWNLYGAWRYRVLYL